MNPQDGDGNQLSRPTASMPESNVGVSSNPLAGLEDVVKAAKEAAAVQTTPPVEPTAQTPKDQFASQFGEAVPPVEPMATTPPVTEPASGLMDTALSNLATLQQTQAQPVVETLAQPEPEQTPAEKLRKEIADSVDAFFKEVAKEQAPA